MESVTQQRAHVERYKFDQVLERFKAGEGDSVSNSELIEFFDQLWNSGGTGKSAVTRMINGFSQREKRHLRRAVQRRKANEKTLSAGRTK